jgi:hypothetical protein
VGLGPCPVQGVELRVADGLEDLRRDHLALAAHDAVDGARRVLEELGGHERRAVPADHDEHVGVPGLGVPGQVDHLGHVGQIVHREADRLRREGHELPPVFGVLKDLQVEQLYLVAGGSDRRGHPLEAERLQTEVQLGVHQRARMDEQHSHETISSRRE